MGRGGTDGEGVKGVKVLGVDVGFFVILFSLGTHITENLAV